MPNLLNIPSSPYIEFETGIPNQKGVVFSGIAVPEWHLNDDDNIHRMLYTVNLGYKVLAVLQGAVSFGLASIYNGGSGFLFATDWAQLCIDETTQELNLQVDLALMGDPANLSRFGYQVVVLVTTQLTGISGTISFPAGLFGASSPTVAELNQLFEMTANTYIEDGGGGFGDGHYNKVAFGTIVAVNTEGTTVVATYSIAAAPYNTDVTVLVITKSPTQPNTGFSQTAGPSQILLTVAAPNVSGVDFTFYNSPIK